MKKIFTIIALAMACTVWAATPAGFVEQNDLNETFSGVSNTKSVGLGWGWQDGNPVKSYGTSTSGPIDGTYIYQGSAYAADAVTKPTLLITPQLKGRIQMHIKPQNVGEYYVTNYLAKNKSFIRLYAGHDEEGEIVFEDAPFAEHFFTAVPADAHNSYGWIDYETSLEDYQYVGIQISYAGLDDLRAEKYLVPENRDMRCGSKSFTIDGFITENQSPFYADEEGHATFRGAVRMTNYGNVTLKVGDENYNLKLLSQGSKITIPETIIAITQDCAPGETITIPVEVVMTSLTPSEDQRTAIRAIPGLIGAGMTVSSSDVYGQSEWFTVKSGLPKLHVRTPDNELAEEHESYVALSAAPAPVEFKLMSRGGAPVVLDSIVSNMSGIHYELDGKPMVFPATIPMGVDTMLSVVFDQAGTHVGNLTFYYSHKGSTLSFVTRNIHISVYDPAQYMEDFDSYLTVPAGWCQAGWLNLEGSNWEFSSLAMNTYMQNTRREMGKSYIVSPKLHYEAGQTLTLGAQPRTIANDVYLKVLISTDRHNWRVVGFLGSTSEATEQEVNAALVQAWDIEGAKSGDLSKLSATYCRPYSFAMPEGDYYVGLAAGYSIVDYILGGTKAAIEHDFYLQYDGPMRAVAGEPYHAGLIVRNMLDKGYSKRDYTVRLRQGETTLHTPSREAILPLAIDTFELAFTPEESGVETIVAEILVGENVIASYSKTIYIAGPISHVVTTTDAEKIATCFNAPLNTEYGLSQTEWIYTGARINLEAGTEITSICFPYYSTGKEVNSQTTIYIENTEDEAVDAEKGYTDFGEAIPFYMDRTDYKVDGSAQHPSLMIFVADEPIIYTGQNLRIQMSSTAADQNSRIYFQCENVSGSVLEKHANYVPSFGTQAPNIISNLPVAWIGYGEVEKPIPSQLEQSEQKVGARKVLYNGQIIIIRDCQMYTIDGRKL